MEDKYPSLGRCPVCGKGEIVSSDYGWHCNSISAKWKAMRIHSLPGNAWRRND
jgi:hypothetical protein